MEEKREEDLLQAALRGAIGPAAGLCTPAADAQVVLVCLAAPASWTAQMLQLAWGTAGQRLCILHSAGALTCLVLSRPHCHHMPQ